MEEIKKKKRHNKNIAHKICLNFNIHLTLLLHMMRIQANEAMFAFRFKLQQENFVRNW